MKKVKELSEYFQKKKENRKLKVLSEKEITQIRENVKNKSKNKKVAKKIIKNDNREKKKANNLKSNNTKKTKVIDKNVNKKQNEVFDVCTILKKWSIDEISKYLLEKGKNKDFPDITIRQ